MAKVSVVTPLHNGAAYIAQNIRSVREQTFGDYEHLIIDNMSTDGGAKIAAGFAREDSRIRLLSNDAVADAGATRNVGIAAASGRYIAFLDCDDTWYPEKLERQIEAMEANHLAFSWTSYDVSDADGNILRTQVAREKITYRDFVLKRAQIGCLTAVWDVTYLGKFEMPVGDVHEDFCLWSDLIRTADIYGAAYGGIPQSLARYRTHLGGKSASKVSAAKMHWRSCRQHLKLGLIPASYCFVHYALNALRDRAKV